MLNDPVSEIQDPVLKPESPISSFLMRYKTMMML